MSPHQQTQRVLVIGIVCEPLFGIRRGLEWLPATEQCLGPDHGLQQLKNAPGIVELGREVFAMPLRIGTPGEGLTGLVDSVESPRMAVPTVAA